MPTATIQMQNSAIDSTREIFSADQVSMWRSCRRARRGPRPAARPRSLGAVAGCAAPPALEAGLGGGCEAAPPCRWPAGARGMAWVPSTPTAAEVPVVGAAARVPADRPVLTPCGRVVGAPGGGTRALLAGAAGAGPSAAGAGPSAAGAAGAAFVPAGDDEPAAAAKTPDGGLSGVIA